MRLIFLYAAPALRLQVHTKAKHTKPAIRIMSEILNEFEANWDKILIFPVY